MVAIITIITSKTKVAELLMYCSYARINSQYNLIIISPKHGLSSILESDCKITAHTLPVLLSLHVCNAFQQQTCYHRYTT